MTLDQRADAPLGRCGDPDCGLEWLLDPAGPDDPDWIARIRAELAAAPSLVGRNAYTHPRWRPQKETAA